MRYTEDATKSAEYLRQAIPMMSRHTAPLNPMTYAVWYEVVAGINPALAAAVEESNRKGEVLDSSMTASLFRRFIAEIDEESAQRISDGFQRVLAGISQSASVAGDQANRFSESLALWDQGLNEVGMRSGLQAGIDRMRGDTQDMQGAVADLATRLEDSRREIEVLRQEVSRAREDALADGLTGLVNRRGFDMALATCLEQAVAAGKSPCLLITDIDHFKKVNDVYGHLMGDRVIRAVAHVLKQNVKGKDTAARYGGEEFAILLPDTPLRGAQSLAESIRATVENARIKRTDNNETVARITVSFGVAAYTPGESAIEFIERADKALYESKHAGRNRVTTAIDPARYAQAA